MDEESFLMELGVEICKECLRKLKISLKDGVIAELYLPHLHSHNMCKNYYQCSCNMIKYCMDLQCIRYDRSKEGQIIIKFSNIGRRRLFQ